MPPNSSVSRIKIRPELEYSRLIFALGRLLYLDCAVLLLIGRPSARNGRSSPIIAEFEERSNPRLGLSRYVLQPSARVGECLETPARLTTDISGHQVPREQLHLQPDAIQATASFGRIFGQLQ